MIAEPGNQNALLFRTLAHRRAHNDEIYTQILLRCVHLSHVLVSTRTDRYIDIIFVYDLSDKHIHTICDSHSILIVQKYGKAPDVDQQIAHDVTRARAPIPRRTQNRPSRAR